MVLVFGAPFSSMSRLRRRLAYGAAGVGLVSLGIPLIRAEQRMRATGGRGIVGLELAGPERVDGILERWGEPGTKAARTSLALDQFWLATYSVLLAGVWTAVSERLHLRGRPWLGRGAAAAGWAALGAGGLDAVENTALLGVVTGHGPRQTLARVAQRSAQLKFALLTLPVIGVVINAVGHRVAARRSLA